MNNLFPENSYLGSCSCGVTYLAPKGTLHCSNCLYKRIAELENHIQSLKVINEYIDEGCPDIQVVRSEIGEVISRAEGTYLKAVKEQE